ncbi:MAG TPA: hypothetical protein VHL14_11430, partial [Steroidobacteraceae bacterium]|nr:hypothetical protein [Steroidobacteraceae bacterium]
MNITKSRSRCGVLAAVISLVILQSGCGKFSDVGKESPQAVPQAKASTLGQAYSRDANGNITAVARAGSDVVLSGKDSLKSPDDTGLPVLDFKWEQVSSDAVKVRMIRRTSNTVSFTAPEVTQDTVLNFKMTVANAKGVTASSTAQITVKPVRDDNRFLQYLRADNSFPVVLITQNGIAANSTALATDVLPLSIKLTKLVTFTDRSGVVRTRVPVGDAIVTNASWTARAGSSASCTANENPKARLTIPRVDMDDVLNAPVPGFPDAVVLSDVLETSDIDDVTLEVQIDLSSTNASVTAAVPGICVNGATTSSLAGTIMTTESLYANNLPRDSRASAVAYFAAIDPTNAKDTMDKWLVANGFDPTVDGWKADAHAIYTNNFDLGFGRNMYMKYGACDNGYAGLPLEQRIGHCDVAAIVVNYVDIEAAAKKLNPVVGVAMEYSASPGTGARYTKFYTFAPDTRTGVFKRVLSVNLDRRGEEYMPQACVVCHGGTPGNATTYATSADIGAGFLSWDLESFLFPETDPGFGIKPANDDIRKQYSRSTQSAELKKLNEGAYLTFADPSAIPGRFALARELVEKWYGGLGMPNATYDDSTVPAGWQPGGANNNPADSDKVYKEIFARHCRACHILQVPAAGDPRNAMITPPGASAPVNACSNDTALANTTVGITSQVPMGCYWQFAHAPNLATHVGDGQMPFARRTMDQMWTTKDGSQSAGQKLQTHLFTTQGVNVATPGAVVACIDNFGTPISGQTASEVLRNTWVVLGSSCSHYLNGQRWTLNTPAGSHAVLIGTDTDAPKFQPDVQGDYTVTLTDKAGLVTTTAVSRVLTVAPTAGNGTRNVVLDGAGNASIDVDVMQLAGSQSRDPLSAAAIVSTTGATATVQS